MKTGLKLLLILVVVFSAYPLGATSALPGLDLETSSTTPHVPIKGGLQGKSCFECHINSDPKWDTRPAKYSVAEAWDTYLQTPHGRLWTLGDHRAPHCANCHFTEMWSEIKSVDRADSPIHPANVGKTCAKCHGDSMLNARISEGSMHLDLKDRPIVGGKALPPGYAFIPGVNKREDQYLIGGIDIVAATNALFHWLATSVLSIMFLYLVFDCIRNIIDLRRQRRAKQDAPPKEKIMRKRFGPLFIAQHILLFSAVIVAVVTGLPLKFPDSNLAKQAVSLVGGYEMRHLLHLLAGYVMVGLGCLHFIGHILSVKTPFWKQEIIPNFKDVGDFFKHNLYNLGLRKSMPAMGRYTWFEKMDYWGAVWGIGIMGASGIIMAQMELSLNHMSLAVFQAIWAAHSSEAMLATLFLLVVHMYHAHFRPDHFPGSGTWCHGKIDEKEMEKYHPLELEKIKKESSKLEQH